MPSRQNFTLGLESAPIFIRGRGISRSSNSFRDLYKFINRMIEIAFETIIFQTRVKSMSYEIPN